MQWYFVAALLTILTSSQLLVSILLLWREVRTSPTVRMTTDWKTMRLFPIPSVIYLIHNNVQFSTLTYVDTSTYQIIGNLKIVSNGILFRLFLKKKLSNLQWMRIILLVVGTTTSQTRDAKGKQVIVKLKSGMKYKDV